MRIQLPFAYPVEHRGPKTTKTTFETHAIECDIAEPDPHEVTEAARWVYRGRFNAFDIPFLHWRGSFYEPVTGNMKKGRLTAQALREDGDVRALAMVGALMWDINPRQRDARLAMTKADIAAAVATPEGGRGDGYLRDRRIAEVLGRSLLLHDETVYHAICEPTFRITRDVVSGAAARGDMYTGSASYIPFRLHRDRFYGRDSGGTPTDSVFIPLPAAARAAQGVEPLPGRMAEVDLDMVMNLEIRDESLFSFDTMENAMRRTVGAAVEEFSPFIGEADATTVELWLSLKGALGLPALDRDNTEAAVRPFAERILASGSERVRKLAASLIRVLDNIDDYAPAPPAPVPTIARRP